ncbi:DUF885 family protein [Chloroflexota bacterium]
MTSLELEALAWDCVRDRCSTFSEWAAYYGLREYYTRLTYPSREQLDSYRSRLRSLLSEIDALPQELDESDAIDREVLVFIIEYELFHHGHPPYGQSNVSPTSLVLDGVYEILRLSRLPDDEKLAFVLARLDEGRALFDALRETWQVATTLNLEDALPQAQQADRILTSMLTPLKDGSPQQRLAIERLVAEVGEKSRDFAQWLQDKVESGVEQTCYIMGQDNYEQLLIVRQDGQTWPERLELGEQSLRESRRRLDALALHLVPEAGTMEAALERVGENLPEVPILEEARDAYQRVAAFLESRQLLHVPDARCTIEEPPGWDPFWGEGMAGITFKEIFRADPQFTIIIVPPTTDKSRKELNRSSILLLMAHEGTAGHLGSRLLRKNRDSIVRLLLPPATGVDDRWTFYWEQLLREEGIEPTAAYDFLQEYRVFWCSLRHICDVKLHCGLMSFEECVEFLTEEGQVSPLMARAYAKAIANMPGYFSSFVVGKEQLFRLRDHARVSLGARYSPAVFHQWVGEAGPIPYKLLEREIWARARVEAHQH